MTSHHDAVPASGRTPSISVCICTHDRSDLLEQTLRHLATVPRPAGLDFEVVVVDNRSSDHTQMVLERLAGLLPLRPVREERLGLAHARNAAAEAARGDLLLWTDDDVRVGSHWIEGYVRAATEYPDVGFFGGPVDPWFEGEPPAWLRTSFAALEQAYAIRDLPPGTTELHTRILPYGANFATRSVLHLSLSFNPELGRVGRREGCLSEESYFLRRALELGFTGRWVAESRVAHMILKERQTLRYLREYYTIAGATPSSATPSSATPSSPPKAVPLLLGRPRWMWRALVENEVKFWATRYVSGPDVWLAYLKEAWLVRGALRRRRS